MVDLNYLKMSKPQKFAYNFGKFFKALPGRIGGGFVKLGRAIAGFFKAFGLSVADLFTTFKNGDWKTRLSYLIMGSGSTHASTPLAPRYVANCRTMHSRPRIALALPPSRASR